MCRLFGLHAGAVPVSGTFWLLDSPDSLQTQSHRNPDGAGIGVFDPDGTPRIESSRLRRGITPPSPQPRTLTSKTFVAHVRHATTGAHTVANTHPFEQAG
jgi:predicted glutamine amidotransferase